MPSVDEHELDIPNGENNAENDEEQEQPEVEEQEFYVEGWFLYPRTDILFYFAQCYSLLHVNAYQNHFTWNLVEENVLLKPIDGPSSGHRDDKEQEKKPQEDEACGSEGKVSMLFYTYVA